MSTGATVIPGYATPFPQGCMRKRSKLFKSRDVMPKTKVIVYKDYLVIDSSLDSDGLINKPDQPGQLGFVMDATMVGFSAEAKKWLLHVQKSHDDIGSIDIFESDRPVFCWMGGPKAVFARGHVEGSSTYDASLLTACPTIRNTASPEIKCAIERIIANS